MEGHNRIRFLARLVKNWTFSIDFVTESSTEKICDTSFALKFPQHQIPAPKTLPLQKYPHLPLIKLPLTPLPIGRKI